jgi:hypothetical protein
MDATRIWPFLNIRIRSGQCHGIDEEYPNRPKDGLHVHCPVCSEKGVNLDDGWEKAGHELRYRSFLFSQKS